MKRLILILLSIPFIISAVNCSNKKKENKKYTRNVLSAVIETFATDENNYVRALAIEKEFLWVGTSMGVLQVDMRTGNKVNSYTRKDGLKNEYVFAIGIDKKGVKWFGTNAGGLTRFDGKEWKTYLTMHGLADYWVYAMDFETDGTMWIGTWAGVNKFDGEKFITYSVNDGLINEWVYGVAIDSNNIKWFGTEGGITMFDGKTWKSWTNEDGLGIPNASNLSQSDNTGLGTRNRHNLGILDKNREQTYMINYIFYAFVDRDDNKWFGTWGGGASRFDGKTFTNFSEKDGLAGNIVYSIVQDRNGALWFGTNKGVSKFYNNRWESFSKKEGLLNNHVYAIVIDSNNNKWLGLKGGVVRLAD